MVRSASGLLWAAVGILLGSRWWRARPVLGGHGRRDPAGEAARFGTGAADRSPRRLQAMRLAYAVGAVAIAGGIAVEVTALLAAGVALLNLGTAYRYLLVALDRAGLDAPILEVTRRGLLGDVVDRLAEPAR